ncbi:hypothetical protein C4K68_25360 [Pokkaliibacter plantistimulans]|uniref:Uncharacterized protein n=1 Tax=Proteobacteria bacterium 228 TaxID=2083153 RepID=A0A2S5KIJ7_9PROT|nr:SGNH/GDSL hydrolase family protein [Pokkaliibacter plantistimulans]PPC74644.1 hypothetical protein C4K68_25360 [Pokkaliibacter plantistimulans]
MNVFMLGGSNTIIKDGLNSGWPTEVRVKNCAIGASSAIQNLYSFLKVKHEIGIEDLVITESNVNDSFNLSTHGKQYIDVILGNIDALYYELNRVHCKKVVLIMPFRDYLARQEPQEFVDIVNARHRLNANNYGFYLLDLASIFENENPDDLKYLLTDARHPLQAIMFEISRNIGRYFLKNENSSTSSVEAPQREYHYILSFEGLDDLSVLKKNSVFKESTFPLQKPYRITAKYKGLDLIGIGTWSDAQSKAVIKNSDNEVIKPFNSLNSFNEIIAPITIDGDTWISSCLDARKNTEGSINCSNATPTDIVLLTGLLFRRKEFCVDLNGNKEKSKHVDFLVPQLKTYITTLKFYLLKNEEYFHRVELDVDKIIEISERIKNLDYEAGLYLLKVAFNIRPSPGIQKKLDNYNLE